MRGKVAKGLRAACKESFGAAWKQQYKRVKKLWNKRIG